MDSSEGPSVSPSAGASVSAYVPKKVGRKPCGLFYVVPHDQGYVDNRDAAVEGLQSGCNGRTGGPRGGEGRAAPGAGGNEVGDLQMIQGERGRKGIRARDVELHGLELPSAK